MSAWAAPVARAEGTPPTAPAATAPTGRIDVVQVGGLIDPIQIDFLRHAVASADRGPAVALVLQLNSGGGVISPAVLDRLTAAISASPVPVAVWVGPDGSRALGAAYAIFQAAALRGMAPGTGIGDALSPAAGPPDPLANRTLNDTEAAAQGRVTGVLDQATFGDFVVNLDGLKVDGHVLHTAKVVRVNGEPRRAPTVAVRFEKLSLVEQLLHTAASPSVAYLMLLIGLLLIALEFFTIGIGLAAATGTGALVLASYGLGVLPVRVWAVVLLGVGVFGFCVDLQAGVPRAWTAAGGVCLIVGSFGLYHGVANLSVHQSPLAFAAGILGTPLFMVAGMPTMIRARFSTPTIGRESLVGEMGVALGPVQPEGTVEVRGVPWRARTNRATPISVGDPIRVVSIDGLLLEVEPETGGARDAHH
jgi:membrane-bound serine protease (ClpP class)